MDREKRVIAALFLNIAVSCPFIVVITNFAEFNTENPIPFIGFGLMAAATIGMDLVLTGLILRKDRSRGGGKIQYLGKP